MSVIPSDAKNAVSRAARDRVESELSNIETGKKSASLISDHSHVTDAQSMRYTGWRFFMLASTAGFMFGNYYFFDQTSATEAAIKDRTHMSENTFGLLSSVYSFPNVILPLLGGMVIDVFGVRRASLLFTSITLLGSCVFTLGLWQRSANILIVGRVIFGVGGESQNVASLAFIAKWFKGRELSFAVAINIAVSRLGSVAAFDTQGPLADKFGVTAGSVVGSAICLFSLCSAFLALWVDWRCDRKDAARGLTVDDAAVDETVRLKDIGRFGTLYWLVTISCVTTYVAAFPFMQVISAPYLKARFGFGESAADQIVSNVNLTSAFLSPILGLFVDKFGRRPILLTFSSSVFVITNIGFLLYPDCHHCWSILSLYVLMGIALSVYGSVIWPCVPLIVDANVVGTAFGLTTALQNMGMAISPMVLTHLHGSSGNFDSSFVYILCCVAVGLAAGIAAWIVDRRGDRRLMRGSASTEE